MEEEGCRGTVRREIVEGNKVRGWEKERTRGRQAGGREKMMSIFKGRDGERLIRRERDKLRQPHELVHSDTLCIRKKKDCSATHLCISFIYLLKKNGHWTVPA